MPTRFAAILWHPYTVKKAKKCLVYSHFDFLTRPQRGEELPGPPASVSHRESNGYSAALTSQEMRVARMLSRGKKTKETTAVSY